MSLQLISKIWIVVVAILTSSIVLAGPEADLRLSPGDEIHTHYSYASYGGYCNGPSEKQGGFFEVKEVTHGGRTVVLKLNEPVVYVFGRTAYEVTCPRSAVLKALNHRSFGKFKIGDEALNLTSRENRSDILKIEKIYERGFFKVRGIVSGITSIVPYHDLAAFVPELNPGAGIGDEVIIRYGTANEKTARVLRAADNGMLFLSNGVWTDISKVMPASAVGQ